ncbi:tRNA nucleotidyltransferase/poly(A) polymerase RNA and SrmB- binding domain [Arabidopsis thaliana x Arabidopsis arenosa]|uniref:tRNA nucleotidyltransferase/poly(A) polymerase RNA and SrmB- binding domain n=1 Tax=Arabidopsis thaliana x Arabidopsis arenosa TaxID=1240361 RepID=A0A8T1YZT5_9BRAS|nr:tRNA nucleotidyltransferase/poly(A) polymerase RNA and SrmB- binding domain [Arabidopsis thaliana x Arabidopsis arenosa]
MAILSVGFACRSYFPVRTLQSHCLWKIRFNTVAAAIETVDDSDGFFTKDSDSQDKVANGTRDLLNGLKNKGHDVYLVGGCVRDLILKRTPKDFDILTSAELREVVRTFPRCEIVGRRFPICHVYIGDDLVEVSSFSTSAQNYPRNTRTESKESSGSDGDEDCIRLNNCLQRDFTINGLMFDPYAKVVYDYLGGMEDIRKAKVRTVIHAGTSFQQDCVRIAARLGFKMSKETAHFIKNLSLLVQRLDKGRILMEMNYMLAYGSAEASLRLLWKFGILEILLPIQAAYLARSGFRRRDKRTNMLLSLFANLDKLLAPDRPCHSSLWIAILAFHKALADQPRSPLVVAAFSLAVHNCGDILEAVKITKKITRPHEKSFFELVEPEENLDFQTLLDEVMDLDTSIKDALNQMTDGYYISKAMSAYPQAPYSDLVFIPLQLYLRAGRIFDCVKKEETQMGFEAKQGSKIEYGSLYSGDFPEIRHVFARVVFDTVFPLNLSQEL